MVHTTLLGGARARHVLQTCSPYEVPALGPRPTVHFTVTQSCEVLGHPALRSTQRGGGLDLARGLAVHHVRLVRCLTG